MAAPSAGLVDQVALGQAFARAAGGPAGKPPGAGPEAGRRNFVVDRHGRQQAPQFDRITERLERLCALPAYGPPIRTIDCPSITAEVVGRFHSGMTTRQLEAETVSVCAQRATYHPDYELLATRIVVSDLHKRTPASLPEMVRAIGTASTVAARVGDELVAVIARGAAAIDEKLDHRRDYRFRFFGLLTLARSYLLRPAIGAEAAPASSYLIDQLVERPQHLYMRIALGIFVCRPGGKGHEAPEEDFAARLRDAFCYYDALSLQLVSNATPTLLNAGTRVPQLASCFQIATGDDLSSLFDTVTAAAKVSKWSGGVSVWLHGMRAAGALIGGTGGRSSGLGRYIKILNEVQLYVDQGGNRPGAFAVYLGVDHDGIFDFLTMARPKGENALRGLSAPDLKYALWVSDAFMRALLEQIENDSRVAAGGEDVAGAGDWYLFSPDEAPGLHLAYGAEYDALRTGYIAQNRYRRKVKAGDIISAAFVNWTVTGNPYVLYKDAINEKSNMANVAPIASSNLCVSGDTLVLTREGHEPIGGLVGQSAQVWNGAEWSGVDVVQTSPAAGLVRVRLSNGSALDCTPHHKWYLTDGTEVRAGALRPGEGPLEQCSWLPQAAGVAERLGRVLAALPDAEDGVSVVDGISGDFTAAAGESLRLDLMACGIAAQVEPDGGGSRVRLTVPWPVSGDLYGLLLRQGRPGWEGPLPVRKAPELRVVDVTPLPGLHPTYCFTEKLRGRAVFNGNLTGQCAEVTIPSWSEFDAETFGQYHKDNSAGGESGVCNLAALCLESFIVPGEGGEAPRFDFAGAAAAAGLEVRVLNASIDLTHYPSEECRRSNRRHRPVGVGVMGLADVLARLRLIYGSPEAMETAAAIAASVYYGAVLESARLAETEGPYASFAGSPISAGRLQPDLWEGRGELPAGWEGGIEKATGGFLTPAKWGDLRARCRRGVRNAYVVAYMPTATTSNIAGQNEAFEPFTSNIYTRKTLTGEFLVVNRHLLTELISEGLWDNKMRSEVILASGSVRDIARIPEEIRRRYRTSRENHPGLTIRMAASMAPFVCQSMSMNLFLDRPDLSKILRFLVDGWKAGLKCGVYYTHTRAAAGGQKTSVRDNSADAGGPADIEASLAAIDAVGDDGAPGGECVRGPGGADCAACAL